MATSRRQKGSTLSRIYPARFDSPLCRNFPCLKSGSDIIPSAFWGSNHCRQVCIVQGSSVCCRFNAGYNPRSVLQKADRGYATHDHEKPEPPNCMRHLVTLYTSRYIGEALYDQAISDDLLSTSWKPVRVIQRNLNFIDQ